MSNLPRCGGLDLGACYCPVCHDTYLMGSEPDLAREDFACRYCGDMTCGEDCREQHEQTCEYCEDREEDEE